MKREHNIAEDESMYHSIEKSYIDNDSDDGSITTNVSKKFGMETMYTQALTQDVLD